MSTLHDTIEKTIVHRARGVKHEIKVCKPPDDPHTTDILPPLQKNWESYINVVKDYVSDEVPCVTPTSYVQLAAPLKEINHRIVQLQDEAWPAKYPVTSITKQVLALCKEQCSVLELTKINDVSLDTIRDLVMDGLLIVLYQEPLKNR